MERARSQCFDGVLPGTYCTYILHQNIATFPLSFYPLSHAFCRDAIEEIYNKDASISIHLKIYIFTVCGLQSIEWGDSGIFRCDRY